MSSKLLLQLGVAPSGERLRRKGRHGVFADKTEWSMPRCFEIYIEYSFPFLSSLFFREYLDKKALEMQNYSKF